MIYFYMFKIDDELIKLIDKYNSIYINNKICLPSFQPITLKVPDEYEKKANEELGYNQNLVFSVSYKLKHKIIFWNLKKSERGYYVTTDGFDVADEDFDEKHFDSSGDAVDYIKNNIIKTYEKFQNL